MTASLSWLAAHAVAVAGPLLAAPGGGGFFFAASLSFVVYTIREALDAPILEDMP